ncbi:MAG TPA: diaminopimelate epimerase [Hellea balneolensis]|uniref:Diaminopimelate epimerase n=1 Tax=Hellea balneolensis TaxID=287478 RepID=A0A7C5QQW3_9PROT|nr:diaminopimelate epimerase [Hellea balneolensis]
MRFIIMNGAGNRFGVFDARQDPAFDLSPETVQAIAKKGGPMGSAGADQIIIMRAPKSGGDVFMDIFNADGAQVEACGNASRCIPWLVMNETDKQNIRLETNVAILETIRTGAFEIAVDMGMPGLDWQDIPLAEYMDTRVIDVKVGPIDNPVLSRPGAVSMGNPHCVFFVDEIEGLAVDKIGPMIEFHPLFPKQCNVGFAKVQDINSIRLRVWERGAGLTKACGTGACAALVAAHRQGRTGRQAHIIMDGGALFIHWRESDNHVIMSGPVELEQDGEFSPI